MSDQVARDRAGPTARVLLFARRVLSRDETGLLGEVFGELSIGNKSVRPSVNPREVGG